MNTSVKEQTAFRFDPEVIALMKLRAKSQGKSVNAYVTDLIEQDLKVSMTLPKLRPAQDVSVPLLKFAGKARIPSQEELESDEKFARIWNR